ncbi:MAG: DUF2802 domain-containing protein [Candidatus Latescibacterota bacterium]
MNGYFWQLVFADLLFLGLAACLGVWFRLWLRRADEELDRRLRSLEAQGARLERVAESLQALCRQLDLRPAERAGSPLAAALPGPPAPAPTGRGRGPEERYAQAWRLVDQGLPAAEVARRLDLGLAEVELMVRIQRYRSRS